jgi:DNA repair protein RecO (recombination protein O)
VSRQAISTDAVLLRRVPYGESDLIVTVYTRDRGKLTAMARGGRRSRKRFGGALGLFTVSTLELSGRAGAEMWTLSAAQVRRSFANLATDVATLAHASYGTELVRELTAPEQPEPALLDLLVELYDSLGERGAVPDALRSFELRLLTEVGLAPVLDRCVGCGAAGDALSAGAVVDPGRGGVVCAGCAEAGVRGRPRPLSPRARALLMAARAASSLAAAASSPAPDREPAIEARDAMLAVILTHVGKPLRSLDFIAKMAAASRAPGA